MVPSLATWTDGVNAAAPIGDRLTLMAGGPVVGLQNSVQFAPLFSCAREIGVLRSLGATVVRVTAVF